MSSLHPMTAFANDLLAGIHQDAASIRQGQIERREQRARALAGREVALCIEGMTRIGRPVTANLGPGLAEVAVNTYSDYLRGTR